MILYLHGFLSSENSYKGQWVKAHFKEVGTEVLTPTYPIDSPNHSIEVIESAIKESILPIIEQDSSQAWCIFGSSMGGFYAQYLAQKYQVPLVMINPALDPIPLLEAYFGNHVNAATGEPFTIDQPYLKALKPFYRTPDASIKSLVLLDEKDDVIPYKIAQQHYQGVGKVLVFDDGDHAFQHLEEAWPDIKSFVESNKCQ
ncbi:YqiA/YcfP family alpha/beta fold hydrolase [Hydrogenovibrio sp. 3SP14C1]|uniref:YqiA/YcfP family alpha/beta fold hydrolase n=1 Tax=Hydrogenovibrio sp. 3SP14C1 TaxID=3038774 RepID=UPI0024171888|nr:YqiA/YcfP family alpha/beta fold hydrolase [Hydrogenovibrio sp. 3SP14C1]MDG4812808.1 YqiA/YcfP family alpha/beta fold hydrolase [Hydrogenovibrio sp. 3SP14C1]